MKTLLKNLGKEVVFRVVTGMNVNLKIGEIGVKNLRKPDSSGILFKDRLISRGAFYVRPFEMGDD
jgi:hypothetical protein